MLHEVLFAGPAPDGSPAPGALDRRGLEELAGPLATRLQPHVVAGARVAVSLSDPVAALATAAAVSLAGGVPALFAPGWWAREARSAAERLGPDLAVVDATTAPALEETVTHLRLGRGIAGLADAGPVIAVQRRRDAAAAPDHQGGAAVLMPTAGVWGRPNTVAITGAELAGWGASTTPQRSIIGADIAILAAFRIAVETLAGGGQVVLAGTSPKAIAEAVGDGEHDLLWTTGPLANRVAHLVARRRGAAAVARIEAGHGRIWRGAAATLAERFGAEVAGCYTLAEAGGFVTRPPAHAPGEHRALDVGRPRSGVTVRLAGDLTAHAAYQSGGFAPVVITAGSLSGAVIETGDVGRWSAEGTLELGGRNREVFLCGGEPVWPAVVEEALSRGAGVADVAVTQRPHAVLGAVPVAIVVPSDPERPPFLDDLTAVTEELPLRSRPQAQAVVDQLPLTCFGQVHRQMLAYEELNR